MLQLLITSCSVAYGLVLDETLINMQEDTYDLS